ncbi:hypothetical protein MMAD_31600 [Mycolicibacterium madagascariense]|uniref:STAS domain-containing protein n=1 Tax=Mycolicibacterium madagascariense TaxID=212765 RepID=A0A7I7XIE6_9MYCO|nr:STAS domain-containing protein [Mycolicibacterium madagascariense]MCV7012800.1 STAS domain-containing protein [Mycolicibacterium madagascariense]BBZ28865.1 hypothetical protein MMAD_31600 [Mycolicibacterium madagascariense]
MRGRDAARKPWHIGVEWRRVTVRATVISPNGDLRGEGATALQRTLAGELTGTPDVMVLDMSDLEQLDGDGIAALTSIAELAAAEGIRFCLVVPPQSALSTHPQVATLMETFPTFGSVADALQGRPSPGQP